MALLSGWQAQLGLVATVAWAMLLGGAIGFERELKDRPAGFRTHMLISGAAALLVGLGDLLIEEFLREPYAEILTVDPLRLIEATVAAVGFLGAGTIFRTRDGEGVGGLTTAASLLMAAAIGIAAGLHLNLVALGGACLTLVVLLVASRLERRVRDAEGASR